MSLFSRYVLKQMAPWILLALTGCAFVFLSTQLLRVAPVFSGSETSLEEALKGIGLLLVPVVGWALTPAFVVAAFATAGRMAVDGELVARDAVGLSRIGLTVGPLILALVLTAVSGWIWLDVAPRSQRVLRSLVLELAGRALVGNIVAGGFVEPVPGITFYAERRRDTGGFEGVMLEDARDPAHPIQLFGKEAELAARDNGRLFTIRLRRGNAFLMMKPPVAVTFEHLGLDFSLEKVLEERLDFFPILLAVPSHDLLGPPPARVKSEAWRFALWRRLSAPLGFLALAILSIYLAFGITWKKRGRPVALAAICFMLYHFVVRLSESWALSGALTPSAAALFAPLSVFGALFFIAGVKTLWLRRAVGGQFVNLWTTRP